MTPRLSDRFALEIGSDGVVIAPPEGVPKGTPLRLAPLTPVPVPRAPIFDAHAIRALTARASGSAVDLDAQGEPLINWNEVRPIGDLPKPDTTAIPQRQRGLRSYVLSVLGLAD